MLTDSTDDATPRASSHRFPRITTHTLRPPLASVQIVGCKLGVDYPAEFKEGGGGGTTYKVPDSAKNPKKLASGKGNLYSAMGTQEIKTREYDPTGGRVQHDSSNEKDFLTPEVKGRLKESYDLLVTTIGEVDVDINGNETMLLPPDKVLDVFKHAKFDLTDVMTCVSPTALRLHLSSQSARAS